MLACMHIYPAPVQDLGHELHRRAEHRQSVHGSAKDLKLAHPGSDGAAAVAAGVLSKLTGGAGVVLSGAAVVPTGGPSSGEVWLFATAANISNMQTRLLTVMAEMMWHSVTRPARACSHVRLDIQEYKVAAKALS